MKTKRLLTVLFFAFVIVWSGGCGTPVKYDVSPVLKARTPRKVAVLPVIWHDAIQPESKDISRLFKVMTAERLTAMGYEVMPLDQTDTEVKALGAHWFKEKTASDIARMLKADAVIYINVTLWDLDRLLAYAGLKVEADYEMDSFDGEKLWAAKYATKESDLSLDKGQIELAVFKTYEPRVRRFVDAVLSTLPKPEAVPVRKEKEDYFKWLP